MGLPSAYLARQSLILWLDYVEVLVSCHDKGLTSTQLETILVYVRAKPSSLVRNTALEHG